MSTTIISEMMKGLVKKIGWQRLSIDQAKLVNSLFGAAA
jgi:hypothetical protein